MPDCPLIADRAFVPFTTRADGRGKTVRMLYDTGAQASIITETDLRTLRKAKVPCTDVDSKGLRLTAANNTPIPSTGVVRATLYTPSGAAIHAPFFVCPDAATSILGMNAIEAFNLVLDPVSLSADVAGPTVNGLTAGKPFFAHTRRSVVIPAREGVTRCLMALVDEDGNAVHGRQSVVIDYNECYSAVVTTDAKGHFSAPLSNLEYAGRTFNKGEQVATANNLDDFHYVSKVTIQQQMEKPKPTARRHTAAEKDSIRKLLEDNINKDLSPQTRQEFLTMLMEYEDAFSADSDDIGYCPLLEHTIDLDTDKPIFRPQFRIPAEHLSAIRDQTLAWVKMGIVRKGKSPYNNPIFAVPKPKGGLRIVLDFRGLNTATRTDRYCIPSVEDTLLRIGNSGAKYFSSIDLSSGFYHIPLRDTDQDYTAYTIPGMGQYCWLRSPMGTTGSPSTFCRVLDLILAEVDFCINYVDDVLCYTIDIPSHAVAMRPILEKLRNAGLRINPGKSTFLQTELDYLGCSVSGEGVRPTLDKTEAVKNLKPPTTRKELNSVLGFFNYMARYVFHYTAKVRPLHRLVKEKWEGGTLPDDALAAFQRIVGNLAARPSVGYLIPSDGRDLHLFVDAATGNQRHGGKGFGAVLLQDRPNDIRRPIVYLSRALTAAEENYPAGLAEFKAIVWAIEKLEPYLKHKSFYVYSDHKPLTDKMLGTSHKKTFAHCDTLLEDYHIMWRRVDGTGNVIADFLSRYSGMAADTERAPVTSTNATHILRRQAHNAALVAHWAVSLMGSDSSLVRLRFNQAQDDLCKDMMQEIQHLVSGSTIDQPIEAVSRHLKQPLTILDGVLMIKPPADQLSASRKTPFRIYAPLAMRRELVNSAHGSHVAFSGHFGRDKTYHRLAWDFWWPNMRTGVSKFIADCEPCKVATDKGASPPGRQKPVPTPRQPNELVQMDLEGPVKTRRGKQFILVIIDALTKHVTLRLIRNKKAPTIAKEMYRYALLYGIPKAIMTDNGREFCNDLEAETCRLLGINRSTTSHYHPKANGLAEVLNQTVQRYLRSALHAASRDNRDFDDFILPLQFAYNTTYHHTNRCTPFEATFGYPARPPLWEDYTGLFEMPHRLDESPHAKLARRVQNVIDCRKFAYQNIEHEKEEQARRHDDATGARHTDFQPCEPVLVRNFTKGPVNPKFSARWRAAWIVRASGNDAYKVYVAGGGRGKRGFTQNLNVVDIKKAAPNTPWLGNDTHRRARAGLYDSDPNDSNCDTSLTDSTTSGAARQVTWDNSTQLSGSSSRSSGPSTPSSSAPRSSPSSPAPRSSPSSPSSPVPGPSRLGLPGPMVSPPHGPTPLPDTAPTLPDGSLLFQPDTNPEVLPLPASSPSSDEADIADWTSQSDSSASADSNRPNKRRKRRRQPEAPQPKQQRVQGTKRPASGSQSLDHQPQRARHRTDRGTKRKLDHSRIARVRNPQVLSSDDESMASDPLRESLDRPDWGDSQLPRKHGRRPADETDRQGLRRGRPRPFDPWHPPPPGAGMNDVHTPSQELTRRLQRAVRQPDPQAALLRLMETSQLPQQDIEAALFQLIATGQISQPEIETFHYGPPPAAPWGPPSQPAATPQPSPPPRNSQGQTAMSPGQPQSAARPIGRTPPPSTAQRPASPTDPPPTQPPIPQASTEPPPATAEQEWSQRMASYKMESEERKQAIYEEGRRAVLLHQQSHHQRNRRRDQDYRRSQQETTAPHRPPQPKRKWLLRLPSWGRRRRP